MHVYDMRGEKFGRLTVIELDRERMNQVKATRGYSGSYWSCQCECGNIKTVAYKSLSQGNTRSCGCLRKGRKIKNGKK